MFHVIVAAFEGAAAAAAVVGEKDFEPSVAAVAVGIAVAARRAANVAYLRDWRVHHCSDSFSQIQLDNSMQVGWRKPFDSDARALGWETAGCA